MDQKDIIITDHSRKRHFSYTKNKVSLSFQLSIDVKQELKDFKDLLEQGVKDIEDELKKFNT